MAPAPSVLTPIGRTPFLPLIFIFLGLGGIVSGLNYIIMGVSLPAGTLIGTIFSLVPLALLAWYFAWLDSSEVESKRLFVMAFLWGSVGATGWSLTLNSVGILYVGDAIGVAFVAPVVEEIFKAFFLVSLYLWRKPHFDGVLDGIVYAGFIGMGFAFVENITYFTAAYEGINPLGEGLAAEGGPAALLGTFFLRGILTPFAHPLFTSLVGIGLGLALYKSSKAIRLFLIGGGLLAAIGLHMLWNGSLTLGSPGFIGVVYLFIFIPLFALYLVYGVRERTKTIRAQAQAFDELAHYGLIPPRDVVWLSSPVSRRAVVSEAKRRLPPPMAAGLKTYQHRAVRLAHFHLRVQAGLVDEMGRRRALDEARALWSLSRSFPPPPPALAMKR